jgi:predicted NBD/HSP70 family sugar kinase
MSSITRSDELRYANRAKVLACLRTSGRQSRKQLANNTGLSAATITQVTAGLLEERVIIESDATNICAAPATDAETLSGTDRAASNNPRRTRSNPRGRPQVVLEMNADAATVATVTVNFDCIEVSVFDYTGNLLQQVTSETRTTRLTRKSLLGQVTRTLRRALTAGKKGQQATAPSRLKHITVACQGKVSKQDSKLLWSPLSQSEEINFGSHLRTQFGVSVSVDNDCNMIASALYKLKQTTNINTEESHGDNIDATDEPENFAAVLISYGIGLGLIHDGTILTGSRSSGTELGHMQIAVDGPLCRCGKRGCIEAYASNYAIWRRVRGVPPDQMVDATICRDEMKTIFNAAAAADGIERQALHDAGTAIGHGLANLFAIFDSFPTQLVGLDQPATRFVVEGIRERLSDGGDATNNELVSVHDRDSEVELIRKGAAMQSLNYVDSQLFSVGTANIALPH